VGTATALAAVEFEAAASFLPLEWPDTCPDSSIVKNRGTIKYIAAGAIAAAATRLLLLCRLYSGTTRSTASS
jgi:hypothetical protein